MKVECFNLGWKFWNERTPNDKQSVDLPHDAMLTEKRLPGIKNGAATGFFPGGKYIYTKQFFGEEKYIGKNVFLEFEGIYMKSKVYLNEEEIGGRIYGYSNFYVNLTDSIKIGEENEIKVVVDNTQTPNSRWYSGSGIYREVKLITGDKKHIEIDGVRIVTKSINPAVIQVSVEITKEAESCNIVTDVLWQNQVVASGNGTNCDITIPNAKLWDDEHPDLYEVHAILKDKDQIVDEQIIRTGIRILKWNSMKGLQVNEKSIKLRGGCIHHDNGPLGACNFAKAELRKASILKKAGYNAVRYSHNPASKAFLDACDQVGIYVMDESFDQWKAKKSDYDYGMYFEQEWEKDITSMVLKDINHPSVIMYSIGNEIADTGNKEGVEISRQLASLCKKLDSSRPIINAINPVVSIIGSSFNHSTTSPEDVVNPYAESKNAQATASLLANIIVTVAPFISKLMGKPKKVEKKLKQCFDEVDIVGYNYAEQCYKLHHEWNPKRIMVGSETHPQSIAKNWSMVKKYPYLIGDFMWTAWDYLGEAGIGVPIYGSKHGGFNRPYPCVSAGCGAIDMTGYMEAPAYYAAIVWGKYRKPYIGVRPLNQAGKKYFFGMWRGTDVVHSWSWRGMEGNKAEIEVFSIGNSIELFKDGISLGKKQLVDYKATYQTIYKPGELTAVSYDKNGKEIATESLKSAGKETILSVHPEDTKLKADGDDLVFVSVEITDENRIIKMLQDRKVFIQVEGAGKLAGIGSGNPFTEDSFLGSSYSTYFGRMLFVIRSNGKKGKIKIKVSADGLKTKEMELEAE